MPHNPGDLYYINIRLFVHSLYIDYKARYKTIVLGSQILILTCPDLIVSFSLICVPTGHP